MSKEKILLISGFILCFLFFLLYFSYPFLRVVISNRSEVIKNKKEEVLTLDNNGSTISVKVGDTVKLALDGNITTGYSWEVVKINSEFILQEEKRYKSYETAQPVEGIGGTFSFTFRALKVGETVLELDYIRPWEKEDVRKVEKTFLLNIKIVD